MNIQKRLKDGRIVNGTTAKKFNNLYGLSKNKDNTGQPNISINTGQPNIINSSLLYKGIESKKKILVQFPTRNRKEKFFKTLDIYYRLLSDPNKTYFNVVLDSDDNSVSISDFKNYKNLTVTKGVHNTKINAVNDFGKINLDDFDIILLASDDMIPQIKGYDNIIRSNFEKYFPLNNGVIWFFDGYVKNLNTLSILGVEYYKLFKYIYYPGYISLWADNEFMEVATMLNKQVFIDHCIIKHEHQCWLGIAMDDTAKKNDKFNDKDKELFYLRKSKLFNIKQNVLFEILIPTLIEREKICNNLITKINNQIKKYGLVGEVKVSLLKDNREYSIGYKREKLLKNAVGEYIAFVDDDDELSDDYILEICKALYKKPDCIGMKLLLHHNGERLTIHSLEYNSYFEKDNVYYRPPNHLNPMKRELIKNIGFDNISFGEDTNWAMEICKRKILKNQIFIDKILYHYYPSK